MALALISGISGQDGSYLADLLLAKGYEVAGFVMHREMEDAEHRLYRINQIFDRLRLFPVDLAEYSGVEKVIEAQKPELFFHMAAQSFVSYDYQEDMATVNFNIASTYNVLTALSVRAPACRFYFAGSSEMFGKAEKSPQNEETRFNPRSVYGISKVAGYYLTKNISERHGMYCCSGMLYNHESERRGFEFVTRKITSSAAAIKLGKQKTLKLGNLEAHRDWGYAPEYVEAIYKMVLQDTPEDYVIGTGETHSVREFVEEAFKVLDLDWQKYVEFDPRHVRPGEVVELRADSTKAKKNLNWEPRIKFHQIVERMTLNDLSRLKNA
jgi:GDPmannose 4,6-dehydratase